LYCHYITIKATTPERIGIEIIIFDLNNRVFVST
jgi:hypothetical protein